MAFIMDYWDSIDIGRPELNHSQGFFRKPHDLHEKVDDEQILIKKIQAKPHPAVKAPKPPAATSGNTTKQNKASGYNKENVPSNAHSAVSSAGTGRAILAVSKVSVTQKSQGVVAPALKSALKKSISVSASNINVKSEKPKFVKQNTAAAMKLYEYAEIQKKKKEALAQKLKEQAEKELKFKFHAKPVPKSIKVPTIQPKIKPQVVKQQSLKENEEIKKKLLKQLSMPILPVVKRPAPIVPSCGDPERIKAIEEHRQQLKEKYKHEHVLFKAKPATVLHKPVFQPKHNFKAAEAKPFKLVLSQRLIQRTAYDKQLQENQGIKKKQEEIIKRHQDLQDRKQMRQAREFKANPNPFGRGR